MQGTRQITVLETLHGVRDTSLLRPVWSRYVRPGSLETASEPTNKSTTWPKHRVQTTHNDVRDIPCQKTPNDVRDIEPHPDLAQWFSTRLWLARVSRSVGDFFCVWRWLSPVWCFRRSCRSFGGFPRGLFLVLALSCFSAFVVRVPFSLPEVNRAGSMD